MLDSATGCGADPRKPRAVASPVSNPTPTTTTSAGAAPAPLRFQVEDAERIAARILTLPSGERPTFVDPTRASVAGVNLHAGNRIGSFRLVPFFLCVETWNPHTMRGSSWAVVTATNPSVRYERIGFKGGCPLPSGVTAFPQD